MFFNHAKLNTFFFLNFLLQPFDKIFIGFIGHHREGIHIKAMHAFTILIDADTQPTSDLLTLLNAGFGFIERTDLENVRIIPAFF